MGTFLLAFAILTAGIAQYALMAKALQDLQQRPRVRGDNKILWGLVILCLPFAGAFIYEWMGPTSFRHRAPVRSIPAPRPIRSVTSEPPSTPSRPRPNTAPAKITPIRAARSIREQRMATGRPTTLRSQPSPTTRDPWQTGS